MNFSDILHRDSQGYELKHIDPVVRDELTEELKESNDLVYFNIGGLVFKVVVNFLYIYIYIYIY